MPAADPDEPPERDVDDVPPSFERDAVEPLAERDAEVSSSPSALDAWDVLGVDDADEVDDCGPDSDCVLPPIDDD